MLSTFGQIPSVALKRIYVGTWKVQVKYRCHTLGRTWGKEVMSETSGNQETDQAQVPIGSRQGSMCGSLRRSREGPPSWLGRLDRVFRLTQWLGGQVAESLRRPSYMTEKLQLDGLHCSPQDCRLIIVKCSVLLICSVRDGNMWLCGVPLLASERVTVMNKNPKPQFEDYFCVM